MNLIMLFNGIDFFLTFKNKENMKMEKILLLKLNDVSISNCYIVFKCLMFYKVNKELLSLKIKNTSNEVISLIIKVLLI